MNRRPPSPPLFPYPPLSRPRSELRIGHAVTKDFIDADGVREALRVAGIKFEGGLPVESDLHRLVHVFAKSVIPEDRKSTRLNSSHSQISYAVFCLKKKKLEL